MTKLMSVYEIADNITISGSGEYLSNPINISRGENFGIVVDNISGSSPSYDVLYLAASSKDGEYISPSNSLVIDNATSRTATSFTPVVVPYIKIKIVNNTSNNLAISLKLIVQEA